ncbi:hypothetical protein OAQ76_00350 [bacterium]|nr:hypothetical protein [bacterium]
MGHFSRCKRIAAMLEKLSHSKSKINFVGNITKELQQDVDLQGWHYFFSQNFECKGFQKDAIAIVDSYEISNASLKVINRHFEKSIFIDDFNRHDFSETDLVINFRFDFDYKSYSVLRGCFGPDYFPADHQMIETRFNALKNLHSNNPQKIKTILLYMGALSDEVCQKVIDQCDELATGLTLILPTGPFFDRGDLRSKNNNLNILALQASLSSILSQADIVLCSGGLIKYEAGFCLKPNACINQTEDQQSDTNLLEQKGLTMDFGMENDLINSQNKLREKMSAFFNMETMNMQRVAMKNNFNTLSSQNTAQAILDISNED